VNISRFVDQPSLRTRELRSSEDLPLSGAVHPFAPERKPLEADDERSGLLRGAIIASLISTVIWGSVIVAAWWMWPLHG